MTTSGDLDEYPDAIHQKAKRRFLRLMVFIFVFLLVLGLVGGLIQRHRHTASPRHHGLDVSGLIVGLAIIVACIAVLVFMFRRVGRKTGFFSAPPAMALKYTDRWRVLNSLRKGEPNDNVERAAVERETAKRALRYRGRSYLIMGLLLVLEIVEAIFNSSVAGHIIFGFFALVFLVMGSMTVLATRGAQRYLDASAAK
jgi:hypothetical protein